MVDIKDLEKAAKEGKLDRREFIKRAGALGLAAPFAATLLSQSVHAAVPKKGGRFVQGTAHGSTTDTLDPGTHENGFMQNLVYTTPTTFSKSITKDRSRPNWLKASRPAVMPKPGSSSCARVSNSIMENR